MLKTKIFDEDLIKRIKAKSKQEKIEQQVLDEIRKGEWFVDLQHSKMRTTRFNILFKQVNSWQKRLKK